MLDENSLQKKGQKDSTGMGKRARGMVSARKIKKQNNTFQMQRSTIQRELKK